MTDDRRLAPAPEAAGASRRWALLAGAAFGGLFDGIVLHQILHWHQMLSARLPPLTLEAMQVNMRADGVFHLVMWCVAVVAVCALVKSVQQTRPPGRVLAGAALLGWGLFNLVEGLVNHQLLGLHHVVETAPDHRPADYTFLVVALLQIVLGAWIGRRAAAR